MPALPVTITPRRDGRCHRHLDCGRIASSRRGSPGGAVNVRATPSVEWLAAGLTSELQRQFDRSTAALRDRLAAPDLTTYVAGDRLTPEAARDLRDKGVRSVVVSESALAPLDDRVFNRTLTQPFGSSASTASKQPSADTHSAPTPGETGDPILDANHLVADLAVLYFVDPPDKRAAVVAFSDQRQVDPQMLDALPRGARPASNRILQPIIARGRCSPRSPAPVAR